MKKPLGSRSAKENKRPRGQMTEEEMKILKKKLPKKGIKKGALGSKISKKKKIKRAGNITYTQ